MFTIVPLCHFPLILGHILAHYLAIWESLTDQDIKPRTFKAHPYPITEILFLSGVHLRSGAHYPLNSVRLICCPSYQPNTLLDMASRHSKRSPFGLDLSRKVRKSASCEPLMDFSSSEDEDRGGGAYYYKPMCSSHPNFILPRCSSHDL